MNLRDYQEKAANCRDGGHWEVLEAILKNILWKSILVLTRVGVT
jgi:hypothetical protein